MENMKIATVVTGILVLLIFGNVQCTLVTKPNHTATKIGNFVIMKCSSSSIYVNEACGGIAWKYYQTKSSSGTYISSKDKLIPSVSSHISIINSSAGNCDLKIKATELAGGMYQCIDSAPDEAAAELTTLDHEIIEHFHKNITTALQCSVRYYGDWLPKVQWMKTFEDGWTNADSNDNETSKNRVSINITIIGAPEQFVCKVTVFEPGKPNVLVYDWMSRAYSWKNSTEAKPCPEDPVQNGRTSVGVAIGFAIVFAILFLVAGAIVLVLLKQIQGKCITGETRNTQAEEVSL